MEDTGMDDFNGLKTTTKVESNLGTDDNSFWGKIETGPINMNIL